MHRSHSCSYSATAAAENQLSAPETEQAFIDIRCQKLRLRVTDTRFDTTVWQNQRSVRQQSQRQQVEDLKDNSEGNEW